MRLTRPMLTLALASALPLPLAAQDVIGSGIAPATTGNSAERPLRFAATAPAGAATVILMRDATLPAALPLDAATRAAIDAAIASAKFDGKTGATLSLRGLGGVPRILLVGTGATPTPLDLAEAGGTAATELASDAAPVAIHGASGAALADVAFGYALGQYRFDRYKTVDRTPPAADAVTLVGTDAATGQAAWDARQAALVEGVRLSRDLSNEPANVIYPESFVARVRDAFGRTPGVTIEVLDEAAMRRLNMGSIVGVGQGSPRGSRIMIVRYRGPNSPAAPLALVGKGITFDSGGLSLKTGGGMIDMKADMAGAASVMGAVLSLAKSRAATHVVGVAALAENMPDGNAQRVSDVIRTYSGKTVEIISTDAEGRLVLADANEYVVDRIKPSALVTIATLTGSIVGALSDEYAGLFARDEALGARLIAAGKSSGEELWRMPLHKNYAKSMRSDIADIRNGGTGGPGAGLGAYFVSYFVADATPFAHLDIAGVFHADSRTATTPKGMTGFGVRLLDALARDGEGKAAN